MDIKSVIKTFAEAWAAASLKMDNSSINMTPSLIPAWKTSPAPGKIYHSLVLSMMSLLEWNKYSQLEKMNLSSVDKKLDGFPSLLEVNANISRE